MQVYARILEPYVITGAIPGFDQFAEIGADGQQGRNVCYNHPGYIGVLEIGNRMISSTATQNWRVSNSGRKGRGPLQDAINGKFSTCFCEHCAKLAKARNLDINEARNGFLALKAFSDTAKNEGRPVDGYFISYFRILSQYPEVLAYERFMKGSR